MTRRTLAAITLARAELDAIVDSTMGDLTHAWQVAWLEIEAEWNAAVAELIELGGKQWPTPSQIRRAQRAQNAAKVTVEVLNELVKTSRGLITGNLADLITHAEASTEAIVRSSVPARFAPQLGWTRVDRGALRAIVKRTTQQITVRMWPLQREATAQMKAELVRGVAIGENPRKAATRMLRRVEGRFNGGLARANNIASTEMLDAHRHAARESRKENAEVLDGWMWLASLDKRTCPSCLAQNGTKHPADEFGPNDHQRGRCTAVPITKTWRQLGIDLDEPPSTFPDARAWFDKQPRADRIAIMGKERLRRYESGHLPWTHMSQKVTNPDWRTSYHLRALDK